MSELSIILILLVIAIAMFAINKPRLDIVALIMLVALPFTGVLTMGEALAGFSDLNIVLIAALYVIGEGLVRTGIARRLGDWLIAKVGRSEIRLIFLLMVVVCGLGATMRATAVTAIFIPVALRLAAELIVGAVGQENWDVEIFGKASHAGVAPEKGISATVVAATALTEAHRAGWFAKVVKPKGTGTSNPGIFGGKDGKAAGDATNVVTDYVYIKGEARSSDAKFAAAFAAAYGETFEKAGAMVKDAGGATAKVKFKAQAAHPPCNVTKDAAVVMHAKRSAELIGLKPTTLFSKGGLHANRFVKHGLPTVTIDSGQYGIHTVKEYVVVAEFINGCRLAVALATSVPP
jgi:Citrate transporter/Peptidase dimerisation domain